MLILSHVPQAFTGDQIEQIRQGFEQLPKMATGCRRRTASIEPALEDASDSTDVTQMGEFDRLESGYFAYAAAEWDPIDSFDIVTRYSPSPEELLIQNEAHALEDK